MRIKICSDCGKHNPLENWNCSSCRKPLSLDDVTDLNEGQVELSDDITLSKQLESEQERSEREPSQPFNERIKFALSGMRTGIVISLIAWLIAQYDAFVFVANLLVLIAIGALYGGISKNGGTGAKNGGVIGLFYGIFSSLLTLITLLPIIERVDTSKLFGSVISAVLVMGILGMIVGAVMKKLFGED